MCKYWCEHCRDYHGVRVRCTEERPIGASSRSPGCSVPLFGELEELSRRADASACDGCCDEQPPYRECSGCAAARTINEAGDMLRKALRN